MKTVHRVKSSHSDVHGVKIVFESFPLPFPVRPRYKVIARNHLIKTYACNGDRGVLTSTPIAGAIKENVRLENYHGTGTEREIIAEFNLTKRTLKGRNVSFELGQISIDRDIRS